MADESILQHIDPNTEVSDLVFDFLNSHPVKRHGIVVVDVRTLRETISEFEQPDRGASCCALNFQLLPDIEIALHTYQVNAEWLETWVWTGIDSVNGNESVVALLTVSIGDRVTGNFNGLGNRIRLEPLDRRGTHIVWESEPFELRID